MARRVEFWFDLSCPYAYLGSTQIEAVCARTGAELDARPMLLGGVFRAREVPQKLFSVLSPAKARHNALDLVRWARRFGVPYAMPDGHPFRTVTALRSMLAVGAPFTPLAHAFYRAYWVEGRDLGVRAEVARVLAAEGHDAEAVLARAESQPVKDELRARTDEAIARGVFGAPACFVDGELYWGQDRLGEVERALGGSLAAPPPSSSAAATLYVDVACPYSWLGLAEGLRAFPSLTVRAVSLQDLLAHEYPPDGELPAQSEAKDTYLTRDLRRRAPGLALGRPWPLSTDRSGLGLLALLGEEHPERLTAGAVALARECWERGRDPDDPIVLLDVARELDLEPLVARAVAGEGEDALARNLRLAIEDEVFGVPTLVVGREVYFGADRLELALFDARG